MAETQSRIACDGALAVQDLGQEDDGRWWADIESMPGVVAYGGTREEAIAAVRGLAFRVAAGCIDHGEEVPASIAKNSPWHRL